jgi:hypothetical protein
MESTSAAGTLYNCNCNNLNAWLALTSVHRTTFSIVGSF